MEANGSTVLQRAIDDARRNGRHYLTISGDYLIDRAILLPSDLTLRLEDAHLRLADSCFCNIFRNEHAGELTATDHDIAIEGAGRCILDGGNYNGLSERNSLTGSLPHISQNNTILLANVQGFRLTGLSIIDQRWWGIDLLACRGGLARDISFRSSPLYCEEDGTMSNILRERGSMEYSRILIKNSDGIDIRRGCRDISVENITGFTEDDGVAITGLNGRLEELYCPPGMTDIQNISVRGVRMASWCANVRLLNQGGVRLSNILIDGVFDTSASCPWMERGEHGVRIGDLHMYGERHSLPGETDCVTVRNVYSRAQTVLRLNGSITNSLFDNINGFDGAQTVLACETDNDVSGFFTQEALWNAARS